MNRVEQTESAERASTSQSAASDGLRNEAFSSFQTSDIYQKVFGNAVQEEVSRMGFPNASLIDSTNKQSGTLPSDNKANPSADPLAGKKELEANAAGLIADKNVQSPSKKDGDEKAKNSLPVDPLESRAEQVPLPAVEEPPVEEHPAQKQEPHEPGEGETSEAQEGKQHEIPEKPQQHSEKHGRKRGDGHQHEKHGKHKKHGKHGAHKKHGGKRHHKKHGKHHKGKGKHHDGSTEDDKEEKNEDEQEPKKGEHKPENNKNGKINPEKKPDNQGKEAEKQNDKSKHGDSRKDEQPESKREENGKPGDKDKQKSPEPAKPGDKQDTSNKNLPDGVKVTRTADDLKTFYRHQDDGVSCSAFSMGMLVSDQTLGRPMQYGAETQSFKELAGTTSHGYRGDLQSIADKLESKGLQAKAYQYDHVGKQTMDDLNKELDQGHSAVARVINPHTGNPHYIYVAGRDQNGNYIIGDPDRYNTQHFAPVPAAHLQKIMSGRDGFVAGWSDQSTRAAQTPGTIAYRLAMAKEKNYA